MKRRSFVATAAAATLAAPHVMAQRPVTLTFRFNDPEGPQLRAALDEFERQNPTIKVTLQRVSWADAQAQYLREAAVGAAPDVAQVAFAWPRAFAAADALRPIDDLLARGKIGVRGWDDFVARDLAFGADGKIYGVPWTFDTFAMFYNKELLQQAGVDKLPTAWDELREVSKRVHQRTGKAGWAFPAGSCATPAVWFFLNYYWWAQGPGFIDRGADGRYVMGMTPQKIQEGFDYFDQYLKEGHNPRANVAVCLWGAPELIEGLASGNVAIASLPDPVAIQAIDAWKQRNPGKPLPFVTAPHPGGPNGSRTHLGGRMLSIGHNCKNVDQAWALIQFLCQPDPTFTKHYTNYTPSQLAAVDARVWPPELAGYPAQLKTARSWGPYITGPVSQPFMWNATGRAAGSVFIGEKTSAQAAAELHDLIGKELAKNQK